MEAIKFIVGVIVVTFVLFCMVAGLVGLQALLSGL